MKIPKEIQKKIKRASPKKELNYNVNSTIQVFKKQFFFIFLNFIN